MSKPKFTIKTLDDGEWVDSNLPGSDLTRRQLLTGFSSHLLASYCIRSFEIPLSTTSFPSHPVARLALAEHPALFLTKGFDPGEVADALPNFNVPSHIQAGLLRSWDQSFAAKVLLHWTPSTDTWIEYLKSGEDDTVSLAFILTKLTVEETRGIISTVGRAGGGPRLAELMGAFFAAQESVSTRLPSSKTLPTTLPTTLVATLPTTLPSTIPENNGGFPGIPTRPTDTSHLASHRGASHLPRLPNVSRPRNSAELRTPDLPLVPARPTRESPSAQQGMPTNATQSRSFIESKATPRHAPFRSPKVVTDGGSNNVREAVKDRLPSEDRSPHQQRPSNSPAPPSPSPSDTACSPSALKCMPQRTHPRLPTPGVSPIDEDSPSLDFQLSSLQPTRSSKPFPLEERSPPDEMSDTNSAAGDDNVDGGEDSDDGVENDVEEEDNDAAEEQERFRDVEEDECLLGDAFEEDDGDDGEPKLSLAGKTAQDSASDGYEDPSLNPWTWTQKTNDVKVKQWGLEDLINDDHR